MEGSCLTTVLLAASPRAEKRQCYCTRALPTTFQSLKLVKSSPSPHHAACVTHNSKEEIASYFINQRALRSWKPHHTGSRQYTHAYSCGQIIRPHFLERRRNWTSLTQGSTISHVFLLPVNSVSMWPISWITHSQSANKTVFQQT
jgi:hypothetical protein